MSLGKKDSTNYIIIGADGEINEKVLNLKKFPLTIIKALGLPAEKNIETNKEEITRCEKKISKL